MGMGKRVFRCGSHEKVLRVKDEKGHIHFECTKCGMFAIKEANKLSRIRCPLNPPRGRKSVRLVK
jgi:hypothetical protein